MQLIHKCSCQANHFILGAVVKHELFKTWEYNHENESNLAWNLKDSCETVKVSQCWHLVYTCRIYRGILSEYSLLVIMQY